VTLFICILYPANKPIDIKNAEKNKFPESFSLPKDLLFNPTRPHKTRKVYKKVKHTLTQTKNILKNFKPSLEKTNKIFSLLKNPEEKI